MSIHHTHSGKRKITELPYNRLRLGDILHITATDAKADVLRTFQIQVVGFEVASGLRHPVFRFGKNNFSFLDGNGYCTKIVQEGTLATPGISTVSGNPKQQVAGSSDTILVGWDYVFIYLNGGSESAHVIRIADIKQVLPPPGWKQPQEEMKRYLAMRHQTILETERRERLFAHPLTIWTVEDLAEAENERQETEATAYRLEKANDSGCREMILPDGNAVYGRPMELERGNRLLFQVDHESSTSIVEAGYVKRIEIYLSF